MAVNTNLTIENARICFRNFSGKEGKYNPAGKRNFCVLLNQSLADNLVAEGWNVRYLPPRDPEDEPQAYLQVAVSFGTIPPKIVLVTRKGKKTLDEGEVGMLDWAELSNVDMIIRPYNWDVSGRTGVKAYVKVLYATIVEDELEAKYADIEDSAMNAIPYDMYEG